MPSKGEITTAGIKYRGTWEEICKFAEYLSEIIKDYFDSLKDLSDYNNWKPEKEEDEEELSERTAEEASIEKTKMEKKFDGPKEELSDASSDILDSIEKVANGKDPRGKIKKACERIGRTMGAGSIKSIRELEKRIYEKMMLQLNPYYFDARDFSINLENGNDSDIYTMTLNIPDEKLRNNVQEEVKEDLQ